MDRKLVIAGVLVLAVLVLAFLFYIFQWETPITGFIIKNQDSKNGLLSRFVENGQVVEVYLTNIGVEKIKLPEGAKDSDAIMLLASIYMKNEGRNMKNYKILDTVKSKGRELSHRFKAYYVETEEIWKINYYSDAGFLKVSTCSVKIKYDGELEGIDCKDK